MARLEYVTACWEQIGRLDTAVSRGWLAHIMKRYLLSHVTSGEEIFQSWISRKAKLWCSAAGNGCTAWKQARTLWD